MKREESKEFAYRSTTSCFQVGVGGITVGLSLVRGKIMVEKKIKLIQ